MHIREDATTVQLCGETEIAGKRINGQHGLSQKYRGRIGQSKDIELSVEKKDRPSFLKDRRLREAYLQRKEPGSRSLGEPGSRKTEIILYKR